jgi:hypothetical protein
VIALSSRTVAELEAVAAEARAAGAPDALAIRADARLGRLALNPRGFAGKVDDGDGH